MIRAPRAGDEEPRIQSRSQTDQILFIAANAMQQVSNGAGSRVLALVKRTGMNK